MGLIEAKRLKNALMSGSIHVIDGKPYIDYAQVLNTINEQPTVDVESAKPAHWINITNAESVDYEFACSLCGYTNFMDVINACDYCPSCGAKMIKRGVKYGQTD